MANNEFQRVQKKTVTKFHPVILHSVNEEPHQKPVRIVCVPDEIRTWHLPHTSQIVPTFSLTKYESRGNVVIVHITKVYGENGVQLHTFLNSALVT